MVTAATPGKSKKPRKGAAHPSIWRPRLFQAREEEAHHPFRKPVP